MIKKILTPIAAIAMVASVQNAEAANLYRAKTLVQEAVSAVSQGRHSGGQGFRQAENKLMRAKDIAQTARYSQAKSRLLWTLDDAIYVAGSRSMAPYRKSQVIRERGNQALTLLDRMMGGRDDFGNRGQLDNALQLMTQAWNALQNGNEPRTQNLLARTITILDSYRYDRQIVSAIRNVREIRQILRDSHHNGHRVMQRVKFLGQEARQSIRNSRAYQNDGRHGGGFERLGSTGTFSSRYTSTETVYPPRSASVVGELFVTARGGSVEISSIEITYANGRTQYLGYASLSQGQKLGIHLRGTGDRKITKIKVRAKSGYSRYSSGNGYLVFTGK